MTESKHDSAYWMEDIIRISEPYKIGKHEWRLVQYRGTGSRYVVDEATGRGRLVDEPAVFVEFEWRRLDEPFEHWWRRSQDWPRYDFNNGQTLGLPVTLRKLYDACPWAHSSDVGGSDGEEPQSDNGRQEGGESTR